MHHRVWREPSGEREEVPRPTVSQLWLDVSLNSLPSTLGILDANYYLSVYNVHFKLALSTQ